MRPLQATDLDATMERHIRIKALLERRKDAILEQLDDPGLDPGRRSRLEARKEDVKRDIASIRVWGSERDYERMWRKYQKG
ncbi:hypothetical protein CRD59_02080 [Bifidobacterium xylocopae]|uniref:Uncharacterized protein n=2 Tax=Bifidobacterium xylocopae TaxID=2493119 RepID=A0A366KDR8_9BIFI|nr:hypothetical protein CRD59_02080 [Bifidobacterium xylocopae]